MRIRRSPDGLTLVELSVTMAIVGVLGLVIFSLLNIGLILSAKNSAMNTAHQQARVAMLKMIDDLHAAVSLPALQDVVHDSATNTDKASGISFQQWAAGPYRIKSDTTALPTSQNFVKLALPTSTSTRPEVNQRLIIPSYQIEGDITAVSGAYTDLTVTLNNIVPAPSPAPSPIVSPNDGTKLPVQIKGTSSTVGDVICYITNRCSYDVVKVSDGPPPDYKLQWTARWPGYPDVAQKVGTRDIVNDITSARPFSIPTTAGGALYYRFMAAIDLSTSDPKYSRRGYKSANILLNGQVPYKARLTTYQ
jgi:prepilin-type N-terminal cleavage/methylation domain-containing protein